MELAGVDGGDRVTDGGDGVAGAEEDAGFRETHRRLREQRDREPEPAAPALHKSKSRQRRETRSGSPAMTLRSRSRSAPGSRSWRKPSLSSMEMEDGTGGDATVVGGAAGEGGVRSDGGLFLLIFLQSFYYIDFIWLKDFSRRRRGRGPAHLSCRRRERRGGQGPAAGKKRSCWEGRGETAVGVYPHNASYYQYEIERQSNAKLCDISPVR